MRWLALFLVLSELVFPSFVTAQDTDSPDDGIAFCIFADNKQLTVRYNRMAIDPKKDPPFGKVWTPGDMPFTLFTESELTVGNRQIPIGAYSMYLIPGKDNWTVVVSKAAAAGSPYDEKLELARASMPSAKLPKPEDQFSVYLGHVAPKQCEMRISYGKIRADGMQFTEK